MSRAVWGFTDQLWTNQISWYPVCMSWSCNNTLYKLSILFMHFYFRRSLLLYVYGLGQTHHSSSSRRAGFFRKGCDKVVTLRIRTRENLIGMWIKFDRCWNESLSSTARGSTDLPSLRSLVLRAAFYIWGAGVWFWNLWSRVAMPMFKNLPDIELYRTW